MTDPHKLPCENCMRAGRTYEYVEFKDGCAGQTHWVCGVCLDALIYAEDAK